MNKLREVEREETKVRGRKGGSGGRRGKGKGKGEGGEKRESGDNCLSLSLKR